jgi:hypothetical protein
MPEYTLEELPDDFNTVTDYKGQPFKVDKTLAANLLLALKNAQDYDGDLMLVVDGEEGKGKSTLARQLAKLLDPKFDHTKIHYDTDAFTQAHFKGYKWEALVLDESKADLDRKRTMAAKQVEFTGFLSQSRQAHKIAIIVLPSIHDLNAYLAEHRAKCLIHVYANKGRNLGFYRYYNRKCIKDIFIKGHKYRSYPTKPCFAGRFGKAEPVDLEAYNARKWEAFQRYNATDPAKAKMYSWEEWKELYIKAQIKKWPELKGKSKGLTVKDFCISLGTSKPTFYKYAEVLGVPFDGSPVEVVASVKE